MNDIYKGVLAMLEAQGKEYEFIQRTISYLTDVAHKGFDLSKDTYNAMGFDNDEGCVHFMIKLRRDLTDALSDTTYSSDLLTMLARYTIFMAIIEYTCSWTAGG